MTNPDALATPAFAAPTLTVRVFPEPPVIGSAAAPEPSLMGLPEERHKVPDTVLDGADLEGLSVRGASLRGDGPRQHSATRRDAMDICRIREGEADVILGCVAGGAVSEPLSQLGAAQACTLVREEVRPRLSALFSITSEADLRAIGQDLVESVADRLTRLAGFLKADPQALSTGLTVAIVDTSNNAAGRAFVAFALGSETVFLLRESVSHPRFANKSSAEPATAIHTLPTAVGQVSMLSGNLAPGETLLICANGLAKALRNAEVRGVLAARWGSGRIPGLIEFGWVLSFQSNTHDDDRTAICFWNHELRRRRRRRRTENADSG
jgi:hypothetical protein